MNPISPMGLISLIGLIIIITENIMKRQLIFNAARKAMVGSVMLLAVAFSAYGNTTETVEQVKGRITLTSGVDYIVTSENPFASGAVINIANTDSAVLILKAVKPSQVKNYYNNILINGQRATSINSQARIHGDGAILLPYADDKPLTVYTEYGQQGELARYGVSTRQTLKDSPLNNRIKSFTLKRGYMAWFATKADGKGYNRVFIADKEPILVDLPTILSNSISALRVSKWNDASKKGYAGWDPAYNDPLNTTWCYSWDAGINIWTDREYVTQHHHEGWPGIADVGNNGTSTNILGNNEPDNTGDDREQVNSVAEVLATWPEMMATGRRLGSPAMASNLNWLYEFFDSIDARGWRCDFVVMHCYWLSDWPSWKNTLQNVRNRTGRPVWITEMNYGANWTGWPGSDRTGSDANYAIQTQHMNPVIDGLEDTPWLERYAIYNWVEDCRKVIDGKMQLTPFGKYYANKESNIAYDSRYEVVPKLPKMYGPSKISLEFDSDKGIANLSWYEPNGEYNQSMKVQRSSDGIKWSDMTNVPFEEDGAFYQFADSTAAYGYNYRICVIDATGKTHYTRSMRAVPNKVTTGMPMQIDGKLLYAGANRVFNGDFDLGFMGWKAGDGNPLSEPYFQVVPVGGFDGGSYLQAYGNATTDRPESVLKEIDIEPHNYFYASAATLNSGSGITLQRMSLSSGNNKEDSLVLTLSTTNQWQMQSAHFYSGNYGKLLVSLRRLAASAQVDKVFVCRLFETKEEAIADGIRQCKAQAETFAGLIASDYSGMAAELRDAAAAATGGEEDYQTLTLAIDNVVQAMAAKHTIDSLMPSANHIAAIGMPGSAELCAAIDNVSKCSTSADYIETLSAIETAMNRCMPLSIADISLVNGDFKNSDNGWTVKCGTFTGGDQRVATHGTKTAWNAWWSGISASEGKNKTMEIRQTIKGFDHGLYVLECKAGTQHFCLGDQHAYMVNGTDTVVSPDLTAAYLDLPSVAEADMWQTLQTAPIYLDDGDTVTVGFVGSKQGTVDNKWKRFGVADDNGDKREGWWCATDFVFRFSPMYRIAAPAGGWGVVCLPRDIKVSSDTHLYNIAGITSDYQSLCLEEVLQGEAGMPYVYYTTEKVVDFYESGTPVKSAKTNDANLRGNFETAYRTPVGYYLIENGEWKRASSSYRPRMQNYSGVLVKTVGLPVHDSWAGKTMPISGAVEEQADGIEGVEAENGGTTAIYDLGGRKAVRNNGVMLNVNGKQVKKVLGVK